MPVFDGMMLEKVIFARLYYGEGISVFKKFKKMERKWNRTGTVKERTFDIMNINIFVFTEALLCYSKLSQKS